jgi:hypothetical protein
LPFSNFALNLSPGFAVVLAGLLLNLLYASFFLIVFPPKQGNHLRVLAVLSKLALLPPAWLQVASVVYWSVFGHFSVVDD